VSHAFFFPFLHLCTRCPACGITTGGQGSLRNHVGQCMRLAASLLVPCYKCDVMFGSVYVLRRHLELEHNYVADDDEIDDASSEQSARSYDELPGGWDHHPHDDDDTIRLVGIVDVEGASGFDHQYDAMPSAPRPPPPPTHIFESRRRPLPLHERHRSRVKETNMILLFFSFSAVRLGF
jgi:hypothetical protein